MSKPRKNDPFADLFGSFSERLLGDRWEPDVDVFETDDGIVVRADVAGVAGGDVRVSVDGQVLRISGVRRTEEHPELRRLHRMEIACGPFERRIRIPVPFDREGVTAHLAEGFLTVTLPKPARTRRSVVIEG